MPAFTKKVTVYRCSVCGHEWQAKDAKLPLRCASCKTPYWNRQKTKKS